MIVAKVRFAPGARTAWHSHASGQTLHSPRASPGSSPEAGRKVSAHPGQTIYCPPARSTGTAPRPDSFMEHLAMLDNADDPASTTTWLEHVTDTDYLA